MRKRYETDKDVENQLKVIKRLCAVFKTPVYFRKLDDARRADYIITDSRALPVGLVEIKKRSCKMRQYSEFMISLNKWRACSKYAEILQCPFILAVQWSDYLGTISTNRIREPDRIGSGGRRDRNDAADIENMAFFKIDRFKEVPAKK